MEPEERLEAKYAALVDVRLYAIPVASREEVRAAITVLRALSADNPEPWAGTARCGLAWAASTASADRYGPSVSASSAVTSLEAKVGSMVEGVRDLLDNPQRYVSPNQIGRFRELVRAQVVKKMSELEALEAKDEAEDYAVIQLFGAVTLREKPSFDHLPQQERAAACRRWLEENAGRLDTETLIDLGDKSLKIIPKEIRLFRNLQRLNFSKNQISSLEGTIL